MNATSLFSLQSLSGIGLIENENNVGTSIRVDFGFTLGCYKFGAANGGPVLMQNQLTTH
jgi:hypothetical protein